MHSPELTAYSIVADTSDEDAQDSDSTAVAGTAICAKTLNKFVCRHCWTSIFNSLCGKMLNEHGYFMTAIVLSLILIAAFYHLEHPLLVTYFSFFSLVDFRTSVCCDWFRPLSQCKLKFDDAVNARVSEKLSVIIKIGRRMNGFGSGKVSICWWVSARIMTCHG